MIYEYRTKKGGSYYIGNGVDPPADLILWNGFDRIANMWVHEGKHIPELTDELYQKIKPLTYVHKRKPKTIKRPI